jgi:NADPH-dependent ferric siderophore reductase
MNGQTMTLTTQPAPATEPFRLFRARVRRTRRLSPSFVRITFTGEDLHEFADNGFDQRIKLVLPLPGRGLADLPTGSGWYAEWRQLPEGRRNPVRTYTARAVRPDQREVDVEMVLHGDTGPASRFAAGARPGDEIALLGPDRLFPGRHGGVEFTPPAGHTGPVLVAGDETALPAVAGILERMPEDASGEVVLEVPCAEDVLPLEVPPGFTVTWLVRGHRPHGSGLVAEVQQAVARIHGAPLPGPGHDLAGDGEDDPLWEVPAADARPVGAGACYAWLAGEAAAIRQIRRHLVTDLGHDRGSVAFMGYWRSGHSEA